MSLPPDLTQITVTGTYTTITGQPLPGQVNFSVTTVVQDSTGKVILGIGTQSAVLNSAGSMSITLPCTDNADLNPTGFAYLVTEVVPGVGRAYYVQLPHTLGSTVDLAALAPASTPPAASAFASVNTWTAEQIYSGSPPLKITTGAAAGDVLTSDASGNATWQPSQSGFANPMTTLGDLIYENAVPAPARLAGDTSNTRKFLRGQASAGVAQAPAWDTLQAGDIPSLPYVPTSSLPLAIGSGGTGQASQQAAINALTGSQGAGKYLRSDGTNASLATIQAADVPVLNQNTTGTAANITGTLDQVPAPAANVSLNSHKITGLANGSASSDAAAFGQIPGSLPPSGAAGGALSGTYPSPGFGSGTLGGFLAPKAVTLTDASSVAVDASLGNYYQLLLTSAVGASRTIAAPSNPVNGDAFVVAFQQPASGGPCAPSFASGAGGYSFGTDGTPAWSTAASAVDEIGFRYHGGLGKWTCQGWKLGFS